MPRDAQQTNGVVLRAFALSILAKVEALRSGELTERERRRLLEATTVDIRKYSDLIDPDASDKALALADDLGVDLRSAGWHDQARFDPGRELFLLEHVIPVKHIRSLCLKAHSEAEVADCLRSVKVAWLAREEDDRLTALGYRSDRPDPATAYTEAGIDLAGITYEGSAPNAHA